MSTDQQPDLSVLPDLDPGIEVDHQEAQPPAGPSLPDRVRVIDLIRPDFARARGIAYQNDRRAGLTDWQPTPRNNRVAHQGKRECARRVRQRANANRF